MYHQKSKVGFHETVEVAIINAASREYKFGDNASALQNIVVTGIAIHTAALGVAPSGRAILPDVEIKKGYLTLATKTGKLMCKDLPLETLTNNDNYITELKPFIIDTSKSLITLPGSNALALPAGPPSGYAVMVSIFYRQIAATDKVDADGFVTE